MVSNAELANQVKGLDSRVTELYGGLQGDIEGIRREMARIQAEQGAGRILNLENTMTEMKGSMDSLTASMGVLMDRLEMFGPPPRPVRPPEEAQKASGSNNKGVNETVDGEKIQEQGPRPIQTTGENAGDNGGLLEVQPTWPRKLDLPIFEGMNPDGWLFRAERYFSLNRISEQEKLQAATVCLEGDALAWFQWEEGRRVFRSWIDFKESLLLRFRSTQEGSLLEQFLSIKQTSTVKEYRRQFEMMAAHLPGLAEPTLEAAFIKGLRVEIQAELRQSSPHGLGQMMLLAQKIEDKLVILGQYRVTTQRGRDNSDSETHYSSRSSMGMGMGTTYSKPNNFFKGAGSAIDSLPAKKEVSMSSTGNSSTRRSTFRQMTDSEMELRRQKGLCYRCDAKYSPGHRCPNKFLKILCVVDGLGTVEIDGEQEMQEITESEETCVVTDGTQNEELAEAPIAATLCASSMVGINPPNSLKVRGTLKQQGVVVLIDSGASHNFISERLVTELQIPCLPTPKFQVQLGDGKVIEGSGICKGVHLQLDGVNIVTDFYPLTLGSSDVILGYQWLATLGDSIMNWGQLTLIINIGGRRVKLQGDPSLCHAQVSLRSMIKIMQRERSGILVELHQLQKGDIQSENIGESPIPDCIHEVMIEFDSIFQPPNSLPPPRFHEHRIILKANSAPISVRPYRYPQVQKEEIEKLVQEMLAAGLIRPSRSPFSSPVLLVKKKDGSWRFCVDYRALNRETIPHKFPIPVVEELLDELHGAVIFSKVDLKAGYHQIRMSDSDIEKTAFRTHDGHYEFLVMPFGLTNAPATFQSLMNDIFRPYLRKCVLIFFDDILIYSKSVAEHVEHLRTVFQILQEHELFANRKKCTFGQSRVEYLGHIIDDKGVSADPAKVSAIQEWPTPENLRALRGFLGLTGYYRRFVQNYSKIAWPLTQLLKKDCFHWSEQATAAFQQLKDIMSTLPVLALPNFQEPFEIETDASGVGVGAVLLQKQHPIAYFSRKLSPIAQSKSVYERELMAIVLAIKKWRPYLLGRRFTVRTDQKSLKHLLEQRVVEGEYQKWLLKLMNYQFDIQYKPGAQNLAADALSRLPEPCHLLVLQIPRVLHLDEVDALVDVDPVLSAIKRAVQSDPDSHPPYSISGSTLLYKGRRVLPAVAPVIPIILQELHSSPTGGHGGVRRTYQRVAMEFFWRGMKQDIQQFVRNCVTCQRIKHDSMMPAGLLQPLPIPDRIWEDISLDFIEALPKSKGFDTILVVVDRLSKGAHFIPLSHPFSAIQVAHLFIREIVRLHGIPRSIVSDRDRIFTSLFWTELFRVLGSELKRSTAYHPQSDGQSEIVNKCLETYLRCFAGDKPSKWTDWLPWAEYNYNTSVHSSTGMTPFRAMYGRDPPLLLPYERDSTANHLVDQQLMQRDAILQLLKANLSRAQQRMKKFADNHRRELEFSVGDMVFVKLRPYRQLTLAKRRNEKLAPRFYGPFPILARIGKVAYRLQLPPQAKIHPVFHISMLRAAVGNATIVPNFPHILTSDMELLAQPLSVQGVRTLNSGVTEALIRWQGLSALEDTWEPFDLIHNQFPSFNLEDKVASWAAGHVRTPVTVTYVRKRKKDSTRTGQHAPSQQS